MATQDLDAAKIIVSLAKALDIDIPQNDGQDTYTAELGQQIKAQLATKLQDYRSNAPMVLTQEGIDSYARDALLREMATNLGLTSDGAVALVGNLYDGADIAIDEYNGRIQNSESLSLATNTSGPTTETRYETRTETRSAPDRELSDATIRDNRYVQTTMATAIGQVNQMRGDMLVGPLLNLNRPLTNFSRRDGTWDESSLNAVNSVIDLLKERNGLEGRFPESGYTPELGRALQANINELRDAPFYDAESKLKYSTMNDILDEASRTRLFAALDRLHAANELRPVTMVETEVEVQVPVTVTVDGEETVVDPDATEETVSEEVASDATALDPNNESHGPLIEARDSLTDFAKFINVDVPAQYTAEFGQSVANGLDQAYTAFIQERGGTIDAAAEAAWVDHVTQGLGLELNDANKAKVRDNLLTVRDDVLALDSAMRGGIVAAMEATVPQDVPGGPGGDDTTTTTVSDEVKTERAITAVEGVLYQLGSQLDNLPGMGGMGGMLSQFGLTDTILTPLTEADLADGEFGQNSQDLAYKLIMGLKMMNGDENPDGTYNQAIGENLRLAILTKPEFAFVREQLTASDGTPLSFFGEGGGALTGASADEQMAIARRLLTFDTSEPEAPGADATDEDRQRYEAAMQEREQFAERYAKDLEGVRKLNAFFQGLDHLQRQNLYDNQEARQANQQNLMLDAASGLLDQWAPGIKTWLQDFFTNSQFGQMISGILSQFFGINVGRLWGDRDDDAALERSEPLIKENFATFYNTAQEELGDSVPHDQVMERVRADIMDKMDHGAFKLGMNLLFKDQDEGVIQAAVEKALDDAQNSTDLASAQEAFSASLMESGREFREGRDLSADDMQLFNRYLTMASEEIMGAAGVGAGSDADLTVPREVLEDDGSTVGTSEAIAAVVGERERDLNAPAVDAEIVEAGEKNVELIYTPNNDSQIQGPTRYAHGRVDDIQSVLGDNAEALGLSLNADGMKNSDGNYSDMLTPYTNAVIEETLIRAQIHKLQSESVVITQDHLDGFDRKLTLDNLDVVTSYMEDKGVSAVEIASFTQAVIGPEGRGIGTDYFSTDPADRTAGDRQEHTVLEQAHFGNQFDLKLAQWVPDVNPEEGLDLTEEDPLRDRYLDYNKDRPCEIPLFFTKEGDTSVFAIIRDKNGNDDPSDDTFRELDMDLYLSTRTIQDSDAEDLRALLDNYNWENPTQQGVQDVINKVLGLDPLERTATLSTNRTVERGTTTTVEREQPEVVVPPSRREEHHERPEAFRDLRAVRADQAQFLTQALGLHTRDDITRLSERDIIDPLEVFFDQQMRASGTRSGMVMLELGAHGLEHPEMDVVLAYRNERGNLEFRYVDYETDAIQPIPSQRAGNTDISAGFDRQAHDTGARRLDDFVDEISHNNGAYVKQGITDGYLGMRAIVHDGEGNFRTISAFEAVYGTEMMRRHITDYVGATSSRYAERTGYEQQQRREEFYGRRETGFNGMTDEERRRLDELARTRSGGFNTASGAAHRNGNGHDHEYVGLAGEAHEHTPAIIRGPVTAAAFQIDTIRRIFAKGPFHGPNWTPEEHEEVFRQNQQDMDLDQGHYYQDSGVTYDPTLQNGR